MPTPWLGLAIRVIPWDRLLKQAPAIIDAASGLVTKTGARREQPKAPPGQTGIPLIDIEQRLEALEARDRSNAKLVQQIAGQLDALTQSLEVVSARLRIALVGAGLALVFAVIALGLAVFR